MSRRRVVYFGTPEVAVAPLQALCRAGHNVALVITRPPKRRGRRQAPTPSPVAAAAADLGLAVSTDVRDAVPIEADVGVVVAYGEHIADEVLIPRRTVNLHFSLLPRWRGAAPVERAILAGDRETGVCLMDVASELDAGAVYGRLSTAIRPTESADELRDRLCVLGIELLLDALSEGFDDPVPQSGEITWADKIKPSELRIDWTAPAEHVLRLVRVGGAWTTYRDRRLKILDARLASDARPPVSADGVPSVLRSGGRWDVREAASTVKTATIALAQQPDHGLTVRVDTARGAVELVTVQAEGRAAVSARDWANGARIVGGERFDE